MMDFKPPAQLQSPISTANSEASGRLKKDVMGSIKSKLTPSVLDGRSGQAPRGEMPKAPAPIRVRLNPSAGGQSMPTMPFPKAAMPEKSYSAMPKQSLGEVSQPAPVASTSLPSIKDKLRTKKAMPMQGQRMPNMKPKTAFSF